MARDGAWCLLERGKQTLRPNGQLLRAKRADTARPNWTVSCSRSPLPSTNQLDRDTRKARKSIWESSMNRFKTSKFKNTTPKIAKKDVSSSRATGQSQFSLANISIWLLAVLLKWCFGGASACLQGMLNFLHLEGCIALREQHDSLNSQQ